MARATSARRVCEGERELIHVIVKVPVVRMALINLRIAQEIHVTHGQMHGGQGRGVKERVEGQNQGGAVVNMMGAMRTSAVPLSR